jgi:hypothetical protein
MEEWKDIKGYEGLYQVSNFGRVKSLAKEWIAGNNSLRKKEEILLIPRPNSKGYLEVTLSKNSKAIMFRLNRIIALHFIPNPLNLPEVNHKNGIKTDNNVSNLEWCTRSYNMKHAFNTGLKISSKGEKNGQSKLTDKEVLEIRALNGVLLKREIAKIYGVSKTLISHIHLRKTWKHL